MNKSIKKISNTVSQITVGEPDFPGVSPPNMWLVKGFDRCALIDTAYGNADEIDAFVEAWNSIGSLPLANVILTHRLKSMMGIVSIAIKMTVKLIHKIYIIVMGFV